MSVKAETLENAERDLDLTTRDQKGGKKSTPADPLAELTRLRQRIATALASTPAPPIPECRACYRSGWTAALRSLEE